MLLSKRCLYGIRATLFMASRSRSQYITAREISRELGISEHYLPKVLQDLTRAGITRSSRGPRGGVSLSRPPSEITLSQVIHALERKALSTPCPIAVADCSETDPCTFCRRWTSACDHFGVLFEDTTIADVRECAKLSVPQSAAADAASVSRHRKSSDHATT